LFDFITENLLIKMLNITFINDIFFKNKIIFFLSLLYYLNKSIIIIDVKSVFYNIHILRNNKMQISLQYFAKQHL